MPAAFNFEVAMDQLMTLKDIETAWIVSQWTFYRWLAEGKTQTLKLGDAFSCRQAARTLGISLVSRYESDGSE